MFKTLILLLLIISFNAAMALDSSSEQAMRETQDLLKDKKQRQKAVQSGDAKKADDYAAKLVGDDPVLLQKVYDISADVLPILVKKADGDPKKMQQLIEDYNRNPAGFADQWDEQDKKKLNELSQKLGPTVDHH